MSVVTVLSADYSTDRDYILTVPRLLLDAADQCLLEMDPGYRCDARRPMQRFAYDPVLRGCRRFRYNGCGGNENSFATERSCLLSCGVGPAADEQEVCLLPPVLDGGVNCGSREER